MSYRVKKSGGALWHIEHGDRYSVDWSFMRPVYQAVAEAMLMVSPKLWLRICRRWLPTTIRATGERTKYDHAIGVCWANAIKDGVRRRSNVVLNHTHMAADSRLGTGLCVMDTGDTRDGSVVIIDPTGADVNWFLEDD